MKTRVLFTALSLAISSWASVQAQTLVSDTFSGGTIDGAKWTTVLPTGSSSVVQSSGVVTTTGRGILATVSAFTSPYSISGTFSMLSDVEHFNIVFRTDLSTAGSGSSYERAGMLVSFSNDGNEVSIQRFASASDWALLSSASYLLTTNQSYDFVISDYGNLITVAVNGTSLLSASNSYATGGKVGFYSREFASTATAIDSVSIAAIPEPGTYATLAGLFALVGAFCFRKARQSTSA